MALKTELIETPYGSFHCLEQDYVARQLKRYGAKHRSLLTMVLSMLRQGDHVIDVGAHIGTFCIPMATKIGKQGHVYAFEALASNYELLKKNVAINLKEDVITPRLAIVTDSLGHFHATVSESNTGATYFTRCDDETGIYAECVSLDDWWERAIGNLGRGGKIDMIKVDVEGMELEVLSSCQRVLSMYKPILFVEVRRSHMKRSGINISELDAFLRPFGYHYFRNMRASDSTTDEFKIGRIDRLEHGGNSFDVLAVNPKSGRYPTQFGGVTRTVLKIRYKKFETRLRYSQPYRTLKRFLGRRRKTLV